MNYGFKKPEIITLLYDENNKPGAAVVFGFSGVPATFTIEDLRRNSSKRAWAKMRNSIAKNVADAYKQQLDKARVELLAESKRAGL